ncbi:haloacid dehalogenase type II [Vineibacter terrae]|uniref:Haloacid dehalogenase type II n=1 Tax=Vineibacter terrae TaxID=2586908 RepID=A0A5C8PIG2_9HYPH|nr:haloacid dehalogenase type II [Vineibacter terrae]TXL73006.1 haloacid dehalogenase type II [Vineibacter terrae]
MSMAADIRACIFDVFGTVVDWRNSVSRDLAAFGADKGISGVDWLAFAVAWRKLYQPAMEEVRSGRRAFTVLDVLHRESLVTLIGEFAITGLSEAEIDHMNRAWHRLDPWPDAVAGLTRLKSRHIIAPCSNGNIALIVNMARRAGLPWDCVLGAETARAYKPMPEAYLAACRMLDLQPAQVLMVAAHNGDLKAAKAQGLGTAFVPRPTEHGPDQKTDLAADASVVDIAADSFVDLAHKLGC